MHGFFINVLPLDCTLLITIDYLNLKAALCLQDTNKSPVEAYVVDKPGLESSQLRLALT